MQKRRIFKRTVPVALIIVLLASLLAIPVGAAPPKEKVTSPLEFFGYNIGDDYQLTPWQTREVPNQGVRKGIVDYMYELERTSNRVRVFPYGTSTEGRPMFYVVITSPSNWAQVDNYQAINKRLADPRQIASDEEAMSLAKEGKAVYWVDAGIHASERTAGETEIIMAYELASGRDEWTDLVLDNLFVVFEWIDPDGLELITDLYYEYKDTEVSRLSPVCYNHYVCHDTNRDFIGLELVEHQNSVLQRFVWNPQVYTDLHQSRDLFYIGMPADPLNLNYHPISSAEMLGLNGYVITQMIADGYRGVFTYDYADMWNPTYNHMFTVMHNGTGGWWELTGVNGASPTTVNGGRNDGHRTWFNPYPYYAPFEWHLIDAVMLEKEAVKHSFTYVARNKVDWLYNFYLKGKTHAEEAAGAAPYAFVLPADGGENGDNVDVADLINGFTKWHHIDVDRATADFVADGQQFHAGDFVIRLNQPYGFWAQVLLTRQDFPYEEVVNPYLCGSSGCREYDTQAWTQGLMADVEVVGLNSPLPADVVLASVTDPVPYAGSLSGGPSADYAVEHESNNGWVPALGQIWADAGLSVSQVDAPFSAAGHDFPAGTFLVHTDSSQASHDTLAALVQETGLTGYAIGSGEVPASAVLDMPGIGLLYEPNVFALDTGWVAIRMHRSTIPSYADLTRADIRDGNLAGVDVIVLGSNDTDGIVEGDGRSGSPPLYIGGIEESGVANLKSFVEGGGTLVLLGLAGELPIDREWGLGLTYADSPTCRGSILRIEVDPTKKVGYGYDQFESGYVYDSRVPILGVEPGSAAEVVAWYPTEGELLQSGYIVGDESVFRGTPAILDVPMGDGNVILITFDTVFRGFSTGQYMFLWNAVFSGAR